MDATAMPDEFRSRHVGSLWDRDHRLLVVSTAGRLVLVPVLLASFMRAPAITTVALGLFVFADVYDGVLARRHHADDAWRRALDSIVDRLAIDACLIGAWAVGALPLVLLFAFLVRDLMLTGVCARMMRMRRVAIKADNLYRSLNLSVAAWAILAPIVSASARIALAWVLLAFALVVAGDLVRAVRRVLHAPMNVRDAVLDASCLRQGAFTIVSSGSLGVASA